MKPLCIDLFCGLGGWTEGFLAEGYDVVGFDITRHAYGDQKYPAQLVLQDVLMIHGSQFKDAAVIVASPPCQNYSYLAMPWSRSKSPHSQKAKAMRRKWESEGPDNRLFDACFRIQREAIAARQRSWACWCSDAETCARCHIPLIVENVRGAQPWVGRAPWNYGSFYLWGDAPALMPINIKGGLKRPGQSISAGFNNWPKDSNGNYIMPDGTSFLGEGQKTQGGSWFRERNGEPQPGIKHEDRGVKTLIATEGTRGWFGANGGTNVLRAEDGTYSAVSPDGTKIGGDWFSDPKSTCRKHGSRSAARKAASAQIAKIPLPLSQHIARVFKPREEAAA